MTNKNFAAFRKFNFRFFFIVAALLFVSQSALAQTSAITYNGRLSDNSSPANGNFQFEFKLYDVAAGGTPLATVTGVNAAVSNGVFNVNLDFGAIVFDGNSRYLEIGVRPQGSGNSYTTFTTRQLLTSVPYSIKAGKAATAENLSCSGCVQDSNINSVAGGKVTGTVANATNASTATNAANLGGQPASAYVLSGSSVSASGLTLTGNGQIVAPRMENLASDPGPASAGNKGRIYYNTTTNELRMSNGTNWQIVGSTTTVINQIQPLRSPLQIATLAWWETPRPVTFTNFDNPRAMAFDGEFLYVAGDNIFTVGGGLISKINISSGATTNFAASAPDSNLPFQGLAFDGVNLWAASDEQVNTPQGGAVYRIKANEGTQLGGPRTRFVISGTGTSIGVIFDGESIWTTWSDGRIIKMKADGHDSHNPVLCNISGLISPKNLAFDGSNIWIVEAGSSIVKISQNCEANPTITRIGANLENPYAVAFDGANLWVTNETINGQVNVNSVVTKIKVSDGRSFNFEVGKRPRGLAFDGTNIWVANWGSNTVTKLRASDGSLVGTYPVGTNPEAVVFDGLHIWVSNTGSDSLTRF